jgi:hypothetical protein
MKQTKRARAVTDYTELARLGPRDASASGSHHKIAESSTGYSEASSVAAVWEWRQVTNREVRGRMAAVR